jgi:signal transduction histidine kinase
LTGSRWGDGLLLTAVAGAALVDAVRSGILPGGSPASATWLLVLIVANLGLLWWRRRAPLTLFLGFLLLSAVAEGTRPPGLPGILLGIDLVVLAFTIGSWSRRVIVGTAVITLTAITVGGSAFQDGADLVTAASFALAVTVFPAVAGMAARSRRDYLDQVERRLDEAERQRDERARQAVRDERARIARELHDVVAHHVSLIGVQAGAARTGLHGACPDVAQALEAIEASSRTAVGEMRHLLDALRPLDPFPDRDPSPGLGRLDELVSRMRSAGYLIDVETDGDVLAVTPARSLSAYRILEEALTNVTRHSLARSVAVHVRIRPEGVHLEVRDPGPAAAREPIGARGGGRGLPGMRERVQLFGGTVRTAHTETGGFSVVADLPSEGRGETEEYR